MYSDRYKKASSQCPARAPTGASDEGLAAGRATNYIPGFGNSPFRSQIQNNKAILKVPPQRKMGTDLGKRRLPADVGRGGVSRGLSIFPLSEQIEVAGKRKYLPAADRRPPRTDGRLEVEGRPPVLERPTEPPNTQIPLIK
ncbi:hypothetical protein EVAR_62975_1 [Eumeta japonica]|uniref:Uncharacterized protein n=1 Tax=Eumeta variegata TaxID=151549 RepID=A0A4C1ZFR9_EUMVA|nr:hypothetical protein EVAR_62975_1 [Eumeta japonica]